MSILILYLVYVTMIIFKNLFFKKHTGQMNKDKIDKLELVIVG